MIATHVARARALAGFILSSKISKSIFSRNDVLL